MFPTSWPPNQENPIFKVSVHCLFSTWQPSCISHSSTLVYNTSYLSNPGTLSFPIVSTSHLLIATFPLQQLLNFGRVVWGRCSTTFICIMLYEKWLLWKLSCHKWEEHDSRWTICSRSGCVLETSLFITVERSHTKACNVQNMKVKCTVS